jgi:hypothetical protein
MAKHLGDKNRWPLGYLSVGSLEYDEYLTKEQARTATRILTASEETLKRWPASAHSEFLRDARILVSNVRASTFFELVREALEDDGQEGGTWTVSDLGCEAGRRPDLLAERGGKAVWIAAVFPYKAKGDEAIAAGQKRLRQSPGGLPGLVVIPRFIHQYPGHYDEDRAKPHATPPAVYLDDLPSAVAKVAHDLPPLTRRGAAPAAPPLTFGDCLQSAVTRFCGSPSRSRGGACGPSAGAPIRLRC